MACLAWFFLVLFMREDQPRKPWALGPPDLEIGTFVAHRAIVSGLVTLPDFVLVAVDAREFPVPFPGEGQFRALAVAVGAIDFLLAHVNLVTEDECEFGDRGDLRKVKDDSTGAILNGASQADSGDENGEDRQNPSVFSQTLHAQSVLHDQNLNPTEPSKR
jgi:hypothetical protein